LDDEEGSQANESPDRQGATLSEAEHKNLKDVSVLVIT
jgi:hypothetical protein